MEIEDIYRAGEYAEGLGHYIRVAIVRLLSKYGDLTITEIISKLEEDYNIRTSYANLLAHIRKLVLNNMKGLHLLVNVDICLKGGENGKSSD